MNKLAKVTTAASSAFLALSGFAVNAYAANGLDFIGGVESPVNKSLDKFAYDLINWAIGLAALASVVMLIASGYMYITANGDEGKVDKATKTLTFAIIGLVVCFIAVILVRFVITKVLSA